MLNLDKQMSLIFSLTIIQKRIWNLIVHVWTKYHKPYVYLVAYTLISSYKFNQCSNSCTFICEASVRLFIQIIQE